jgi:hypothetical protein
MHGIDLHTSKLFKNKNKTYSLVSVGLALSLSVRIHKIKLGGGCPRGYANVFFLFFLLFDERG